MPDERYIIPNHPAQSKRGQANDAPLFIDPTGDGDYGEIMTIKHDEPKGDTTTLFVEDSDQPNILHPIVVSKVDFIDHSDTARYDPDGRYSQMNDELP